MPLVHSTMQELAACRRLRRGAVPEASRDGAARQARSPDNDTGSAAGWRPAPARDCRRGRQRGWPGTTHAVPWSAVRHGWPWPSQSICGLRHVAGCWRFRRRLGRSGGAGEDSGTAPTGQRPDSGQPSHYLLVPPDTPIHNPQFASPVRPATSG